MASFRVSNSGCLLHQLWHKLLGAGQATMGVTGGSPEYPQSPQDQKTASDCVTFGRNRAQQNTADALNRIIGQECSHKSGNDKKENKILRENSWAQRTFPAPEGVTDQNSGTHWPVCCSEQLGSPWRSACLPHMTTSKCLTWWRHRPGRPLHAL